MSTAMDTHSAIAELLEGQHVITEELLDMVFSMHCMLRLYNWTG
jgi:hypothetical protein